MSGVPMSSVPMSGVPMSIAGVQSLLGAPAITSPGHSISPAMYMPGLMPVPGHTMGQDPNAVAAAAAAAAGWGMEALRPSVAGLQVAAEAKPQG